MLSQTCARREFERSDVSPGAFPPVLLSPTYLLPVRRRGSSSAPGSRSLVVRAIAAELSISRCETTSAHRLSLVGRRLRGPPPPSLLVQRGASHSCRASRRANTRALTVTARGSAASEARHRRILHGRTARPTRGLWRRARPTTRDRWTPIGRRGVSSEGAAEASAAARRRGAASRKATLQARAPEEDTPRRPRAMDQQEARDVGRAPT